MKKKTFNALQNRLFNLLSTKIVTAAKEGCLDSIVYTHKENRFEIITNAGVKKITYCSLIFVLYAIHLSAQKNDKVIGIYKTAKDFIDGKLSFSLDCNSKENKIKLNDIFNKKYITVTEDSTVYKFLKNNIYGYATCNDRIFRFLDKKELLLLNHGEKILIYKHLLAKPVAAGHTNVTNYYFSIGKDGDLQKLTINNLKHSFYDNVPFRTLIDKYFKYNTDLAAFAGAIKMYKINWLLQQTESKDRDIH